MVAHLPFEMNSGLCEVRKFLSDDLRLSLQTYMETAQSLEAAAQGKEFDLAFQAAENAMLAVSAAHERLWGHIAIHGC